MGGALKALAQVCEILIEEECRQSRKIGNTTRHLHCVLRVSVCVVCVLGLTGQMPRALCIKRH